MLVVYHDNRLTLVVSLLLHLLFSVTYPLSFVTKRGNSFGMRVVLYLGG